MLFNFTICSINFYCVIIKIDWVEILQLNLVNSVYLKIMYMSRNSSKTYFVDIVSVDQLDAIEPYVEHVRIFMNESVTETQIPTFITSIYFFKHYTHSICPDSLPIHVDEIELFNIYPCTLNNIPPTVKKLIVRWDLMSTGDKIDYSQIAPTIEEIEIDFVMKPITFTQNIKKVTIKEGYISIIDKCTFPEGCTVIDKTKISFDDFKVPVNIEESLKYSLSVGKWKIKKKPIMYS